MFDEPDEPRAEQALDPAGRAREKADEFRMHAELAAVFEGPRKFEAQIRANLNADVARNVQRTIGKLEKLKAADHPVLPPAAMEDAASLLALPDGAKLTTNDYHVHRRPGETVIVRWLAGDEVETFYERLQAHFDVAMNAFREEERQALQWKQDPATLKYLEALDSLEVKLQERYLRPVIREHGVIVLSTQAADEMDIQHLTEYMMGVESADVVGRASAPPEEPTEQDRAWFFKLFSLRGLVEGVERMCFFAFLQKADESF
jgi:hypothetical protein